VGICLGAAALACALLVPRPAGALDNDVQLRWLGSPNGLPTGCSPTPQAAQPQCTTQPDANAQSRFARMGSALGLAFAPVWSEPGSTAGQAGFELNVAEVLAFPRLHADEWATDGSKALSAPTVLPLTSLTVRKGLGASIDLGFSLTYLAGSQMIGLAADLRVALLDGVEKAPDVALRLWGGHLAGSGELFVNDLGGDLVLSKSFGVSGMVKLQPFAQLGFAWIQLDSALIDFAPESYPAAPTGALQVLSNHDVFQTVKLFDNRYLRSTIGLRLIAGAALVTLEGSGAWGTNPVQSGSATTQGTQQYGLSAHVGFGF
jgi:hypothetical protein